MTRQTATRYLLAFGLGLAFFAWGRVAGAQAAIPDGYYADQEACIAAAVAQQTAAGVTEDLVAACVYFSPLGGFDAAWSFSVYTAVQCGCTNPATLGDDFRTFLNGPTTGLSGATPASVAYVRNEPVSGFRLDFFATQPGYWYDQVTAVIAAIPDPTPAAQVVELTATDRARLDLVWIGVWFVGGVSFGVVFARIVWAEVRKWHGAWT